MPDPFKHLHVKRNTVGSPNELSLDVLDAAKTELDIKQEKASKNRSVNSQPNGSYKGLSQSSPLSVKEEAARRKKARRARRALVAVLVTVLVVGIVGVAVFMGTNYLRQVNSFSQRFDGLIDEFVKVDEYLAGVDDVMADPFAEESIEAAAASLSNLDAEIKDVERIKSEAEATANYSVNDQDAIAVNQLVKAADARLTMLRSSASVMKASTQIDSVTSAVNSAWSEVMAADQLAREATQQANSATTEGETKAARDKTQEALDKMNESLGKLQKLKDKHESLELADHIGYLKRKTDALEHAVATGDALLEGDREKARAENDAYNTADSVAASLAAELPPAIESGVQEGFEKELQSSFEEYRTAREQAIAADAAVREYLSTK